MAYDFDGSNNLNGFDSLDISSVDEAAWSLWYKAGATDPTTRQALFSKQETATRQRGWNIEIAGDVAGDPFAVTLIGTEGSNEVRVEFPRPNDTDWHHVLVTYDGSQAASGVKLWRDGVERTGTTIDDTLTSNLHQSAGVNIAARNNNDLKFSGQIAEVAMWSTTGTLGIGGAEASMLALGLSPLFLTGYIDDLQMYQALIRDLDWPGVGPSFTASGGPTVSAHLRVIYPTTAISNAKETPAGGPQVGGGYGVKGTGLLSPVGII